MSERSWLLRRFGAVPRIGPAMLMSMWFVADAPSADHPVAEALLGIAAASTLLLARALPLLPLVAFFGGLLISGAIGRNGGDDPWVALLVLASFCVGRFARIRNQPWAAAGVLAMLSLNVLSRSFEVSTADVVFPVLLSGAPWLLGLTVQLALRREQAAVEYAGTLERESAQEVRRATAEERLRIARDLHDTVSHNISALSLMAQAARRGVEAGRPVSAEELRAIEEGARSAMDDLRRLLGVLRPADGLDSAGPHLGLEQLDDLVAHGRRAGQRVVVRVEGEARPLPPALSTAAYRIVQESLSNARKHAPGATATIAVRWRPDWLELVISNPTSGSAAGAGSGLVGMTERAHTFGGSLRAGAQNGSWVVEADLPTPVRVGGPQ